MNCNNHRLFAGFWPCVSVLAVASGTVVYDTYNDVAEEDYAPQLDYKGKPETRHIGSLPVFLRYE